MALAAIPVFLTGEPAEEAVEKLPGVSESFLELHEEAAEIAIWLMGITGLVSLVALVMQKKQSAKANAAFILACILSAFAFASMAQTGYYGGKIRHTEIRSAQDQATLPDGGAPGKEQDKEKEDDD
jgi:hypothetical protein